MADALAQPLDADEVDRKTLRSVVLRFREHDQIRLARLTGRLPVHLRRLVDALPVLFHDNHPGLPGYVDAQTPHGLPLFQPDRDTITAARSIAASYQPQHLVERPARLMSLFVMGSAGSIGHTADSDLDLWLCCDSALHRQLTPKVQLIERWAHQQGLPLHTFLVDPLKFKDTRPVTSNTPTLLLDEFYRSAVLLAGRYPLWWLVPAEQNHAYDGYARRLLRDRHIDRGNVVDFGTITRFPRHEVVLGATSELTRALATPFKSLLKFMLIRCYAEAPAAPCLALTFKRWIYDGAGNPKVLDPYLMMCDHIERHAQAGGTPDIASTARELLIRKLARGNRRLIRNQPVIDLLHSWGVTREQIRALKSPELWTFSELLAETNLVNDELRRAYDFLSSVAGDTPELERLGAKIHRLTTHNRPMLNPAILPDRPTAPVKLKRQRRGWVVFDGTRRLFETPRLVEVVSWAHQNRLAASNVAIPEQLRQTRLGELFKVLDAARNPTMVLINAEHDAHFDHHDHGQALVTQWDDPLNYSGRNLNLIAELDVIDQQGNARFFDGPQAVPNLLCQLLNDAADVSWHCIGDSRAMTIESRLEALYEHLHSAITRSRSGRHLFCSQGRIFCLTQRDGRLVPTRPDGYPSIDVLFASFSQPAPDAGGAPAVPISVDPFSQALKPVKALQRPSEHRCSMTLQTYHNQHWLTLNDRGAWYRYPIPPRPFPELAGALTVFLGYHHQRHPSAPKVAVYFDIDGQAVRFLPHGVPAFARLRLSVELDEPDPRGPCRVSCGEASWHADALDTGCLDRIIERVLAHRSTAEEPYPIYLSDCRLPGDRTLAQLLGCKVAIEGRLWRRVQTRNGNRP